MNGQLQRIASRRKQIAVALSGKAPDQAKPTEHMQEELRAAANLKVITGMHGAFQTSSDGFSDLWCHIKSC